MKKPPKICIIQDCVAVTNIHDSGYKYLFSNRTIFRQLLETSVDEDWVKDADFDHCEQIDESDYKTLSRVYHNREEVRSMLVTKLRKQQERLKAEIREEVVQEVRQEVVQEDRRVIARKLLDRDMEIEDIAEITGLPEDEILNIRNE